MDFNIEIRKKQLDNLDQLISSSRDRIKSVLNYLGWTSENVEKGETLVQCPFNPNHRICPKTWNEHIEKCLIKMEGYTTKSQFLSESLDNPAQSIYIDRNKKIEIITKELTERGSLRLEKDYTFDEVITQLNKKITIFINISFFAWNGVDPDPRTSDRLISTFSPDERLIFYNHCVENSIGPPVPPEFTTIHNKKQNEEKPLTYEEILAQERDAKRRRAKYKSVHINRKNHTEVMREVINGQMEEYKEWLLTKDQSKHVEEPNSNNGFNEEKKDDHERPHSSISRNSNHSSSSRSTSKRYERHRDRRESSKDRHYKSKSYDKKYKNDDRHRKMSPRRNSDEDVKHKNNSIEKRHSSRERDRRHSSSRDRRSGRGHDNVRRH